MVAASNAVLRILLTGSHSIGEHCDRLARFAMDKGGDSVSMDARGQEVVSPKAVVPNWKPPIKCQGKSEKEHKNILRGDHI